MIETLQRAEYCILHGQLSEAHSLLDTLKSEVSRMEPDHGEKRREFVASYRRFKATVAKCRQRDQMLAVLYAAARQEPYRG